MTTKGASGSDPQGLLEKRMQTALRAISDDPGVAVSLLWDPERKPGEPDAPAWFSRRDMRVSINAPFALRGEDPKGVNPLKVSGRRKHPFLVGLACHEAAHVRCTLWDGDGAALSAESAAVRAVATLLEEPRIEGRHARERPQDREFLRMQSVLIDLAPFSEEAAGGLEGASIWQASTLCILTVARADAGVLDDDDDVVSVRRVIRSVLGAVYDDLAPLWREALALADGDIAGLVDVARRWVNVVGEPPEGLPLPPSCSGEHAPGEEAFAPDRPEQEAAVSMGPMAEAMQEMVDGVAAEVLLADTDEEVAAAQEEKTEERAEQEQRQRQGLRDKGAFDRAVAKPSSWPNEGALRPPTEDEWNLAASIRRAIERARFRERLVVQTSSQVPPGRLVGREALMGAAQRARGMPVTAKPFRGRYSRFTDEPPLTAGVMLDVSGTMGEVAGPSSSLAWALDRAVAKADGKTLSVAFGSRVTFLRDPHGTRVVDMGSPGATEVFESGFSILNGGLGLTHGRGVRILFVISDGLFYGTGEPEAASAAVRAVLRSGGHVIWLVPPRLSGCSPDDPRPEWFFPPGDRNRIIHLDKNHLRAGIWERVIEELAAVLKA